MTRLLYPHRHVNSATSYDILLQTSSPHPLPYPDAVPTLHQKNSFRPLNYHGCCATHHNILHAHRARRPHFNVRKRVALHARKLHALMQSASTALPFGLTPYTAQVLQNGLLWRMRTADAAISFCRRNSR